MFQNLFLPQIDLVKNFSVIHHDHMLFVLPILNCFIWEESFDLLLTHSPPHLLTPRALCFVMLAAADCHVAVFMLIFGARRAAALMLCQTCFSREAAQR